MKIAKIKVQSGDKRYSTVHVFISGEKLWDNLTQRFQRPYTIYRKEILPKVFKKLGWPEDTKVGWSQRYFCPCGCSPCFVVKDERFDGAPSKFVGVTVRA